MYVEQLLKEHKKLEEKGQVCFFFFLLFLWTGKVVAVDSDRSCPFIVGRLPKDMNAQTLPFQSPHSTPGPYGAMQSFVKAFRAPGWSWGSGDMRGLGGPAPCRVGPPVEEQQGGRSQWPYYPPRLDAESGDGGWLRTGNQKKHTHQKTSFITNMTVKRGKWVLISSVGNTQSWQCFLRSHAPRVVNIKFVKEYMFHNSHTRITVFQICTQVSTEEWFYFKSL